MLRPRHIAILLAFSSAKAAVLDFYAFPTPPDFPDMEGKTFFSWPSSDTDSYASPDELNLRFLNEDTAGENGWVTHADGRFLRGDGKPLRFWAVNVTGASGYQTAFNQGRFLAKRGVNMVRVHGGASKSLFSPSSSSLSDVNNAVVSQMHNVVSAMKRSGIYTAVSNTYFVIELSLKSSYNVAGYTSSWLGANPDKRVPYGLIFLDDTLRAAYRNWLTELMTRPNPNEAGGLPLAQDPAVAIVELLNEDNVFFNTFNPDNWPPEQQEIQEKRFFQWVGEKYLDPDNPEDTIAAAATRARSEIWYGRSLARDDLEAGRFQLNGGTTLTINRGTALYRNRDQVEYLAEKQRGFFAEMTQHLRDLGYGGTVSATNWKTANDNRLLDLELETYKSAGVIDRHNYYSPKISTQAAFWAISPNDEFFSLSALLNPRESPLAQKQVDGHPHTVSEQAWVQYMPISGEAPLAVASYISLADVDGWVWFALDTKTWNTGSYRSWTVEEPATLGQFPGVALMYRRGDIAEAGVVMREGRTPESLVSLEDSKLVMNSGYDVFRDNPDIFDIDPVPGRGTVDPAIGLVGKAVLDTSTDGDLVLPEAYDLIEPDSGLISSMTGQLAMDTERGVLLIDTPQTQGAVGFLGSYGDATTEDFVLTMNNKHGAVMAISLDDAPLVSSGKILIQAFSSNQRVGFDSVRRPMTYQGESVTGLRIINSGNNQYEVENIDAVIRLKGMANRWIGAHKLNVNLYPAGNLTASFEGEDVVLTLPSDSLYTVVELGLPPFLVSRIHTRMLPNARVGEPYKSGLEAVGVAGQWAFNDQSSALPKGLKLGIDGSVSGIPAQGGFYLLDVDLKDGEKLLDSRRIKLLVEPVPRSPWGTPSNVIKLTVLGWLYDLDLPYLWSWAFGEWVFLYQDSTAENLYLYRFQADQPGWIWMREGLESWYYDYSDSRWHPIN